MSDDYKLVWSDEAGDLRKQKAPAKDQVVDEQQVQLHLARKTSGKGRTVIEISNLPTNKNWCKKLAKDLKRSLATGGAYKAPLIEVHGEQLERVKEFLSKAQLSFKQIGG